MEMTRRLIIKEIEKILTNKNKTKKLVYLIDVLDKKNFSLLDSLIKERTDFYHKNIQDLKALENYINLTLIGPFLLKHKTEKIFKTL